jgi:hypothetical protein
MAYYQSPKVGTGTMDDPYRPAVADTLRDQEISWSGIDTGTDFLMWIDVDLLPGPDLTPVGDDTAISTVQDHNPAAGATGLRG